MVPHNYDRFREKQDKRLLKRERIMNRQVEEISREKDFLMI